MAAPRPNTGESTDHAGLSHVSPLCKLIPRFSTRRLRSRKLRLPIYYSLIFSATLAWSCIGNGIGTARRVSTLDTSLSNNVYLLRTSEHVTESIPITQLSSYPMCEDDEPPEALLTPNPVVPFGHEKLLEGIKARVNDRVDVRVNERVNVRVSFLVGLDGQVQSAFVLDSGGTDDDSAILRAVRGWRYRPARCNGVPTSSEIRVRFSIP
jgi:TonB family protein